MSRSTIHLTISSAALVVLALVTQATGFGVAFDVLAIGLTTAIVALGTLTGVRAPNASRGDAAIVLGMNRLCSAYVRIDPGHRVPRDEPVRRSGGADSHLHHGGASKHDQPRPSGRRRGAELHFWRLLAGEVCALSFIGGSSVVCGTTR
jgi:hypothetical protein